MIDSVTSTPHLGDLGSRLDGRLVQPSDPGWDDARRAWNLAVDQCPDAVVRAGSVRDVVATIDAARTVGLRVAPQATGHSSGSLGDLTGTVLLRTDGLDEVTVDPVRRIARVGAGVRWRDLTAAAGEHGLVGLAGSAASTGVTGYTLGGGLSWLARSHGLAANSVTSIDVVTADGVARTVDRDSDPDLFWALRGGGGDVAVVTALELTLYPVSQVYAGSLFFPVDRAGEVLDAWRRWSETVPDTVTSVGRMLRFPPLDELPEHLRGQSFVVVGAVCQLEPADADRLLVSLRELGPVQDTFGVVAAAELASVHLDPTEPSPCVVDGALVSSLPPEAVEAVVALVTAESAASLISFELRHLGGMLGPHAMAGGAVAGLDAAYAAYAVAVAPTPDAVGPADGLVSAALGALDPWIRGAFVNFSDRPADARQLFGPSWHRLREVKTAYDPADVIRTSHPVSLAVQAR